MQLYFGIAGDDRGYPDHPADGPGALDAAVVGPAGLVSTLEVQLGLSGPTPAPAVRIAAYLAKLNSVGESRFWSRSLSKDPWSTASTLLGWRDELFAAGWHGGRTGTARVDDLADAEHAGGPLPKGPADRARALLEALPNRPGLRLSSLRLLQPETRLPWLWRRLIDVLATAGVHVVAASEPEALTGGSDLARVQRGLLGSVPEPLIGDGSVTLVDADTALMAAEAIADWIAAGPAGEAEGTLVLAPDGDTALLDHALRARGLPALGLSSASPWRGALQVLPLAFAIAWHPFDPRALLSLLMLPRPPMARFAAGKLARALAAEPGIGGRAWTEAWAAIRARLLEDSKETDPRAATKAVDARIARWQAWTAGGQFDRATGMTADDARHIAGRVAGWAMEVDAGAGDPLFLAVAGAAAAFSDAVSMLGQAQLPSLLIERIIGQVLADGVPNPNHVAEAGGLRAVRSPGALRGPVPRLVWWNFCGPGELPTAMPWSLAEQASLEAAGVELERPEDGARRIAAGYAEAVLNTTERLILVRPALSGADETIAHPLAHQLRPILADAPDILRWRAELLLREPENLLAGRVLVRRAADAAQPPSGRSAWTAPNAGRAKMDERRESATSLGRLLNCQLGWFAQDVLGLRSGRFAELPEADQLFGNLAHEIACRLLLPGAPPPLVNVGTRAAALFEELLPQIAAPLQQPALAGELAAAREAVPRALEALVRLLHERGLEIVGTEMEREGVIGDLPLHGRLDLLVSRGQLRAVLDLKWTRSERRYRDEVSDGVAVQLATYGALAAGDGATVSPGGYWLLRQHRLIAEQGSILADDPIQPARPEADTRAAIAGDWSIWRDAARQGDLIAAGFPEGATRPAGLSFAPVKEPCRFCGLTGLCRIGVEAL